MAQRKALGKGLSALIPEREKAPAERIIHIDVNSIRANRFQPREEIDEEGLRELIASIQEKGVIQPVLVREVGSGYEVIAGERRLRAARALGISEIPALVRKASDTESLQLSLIENLQREGLNPIEEARAYQRLVNEFGLTQEEIAQAVGKDRSSIANTIRLLGLPDKVQGALRQSRISMGHARAILSLDKAEDRIRLCERIVKEGLSVRRAEVIASRRKRSPRSRPRDQHIIDIEEELQRLLGTRVRIIHGKKRGRIQIEYYSPDDLERLLGLLRKLS